MRQFFEFKKQHPGCVLLFRMGDFYELFYDDAKLAHRVLGVTLTQRTEGVPMAGVPYHAVEGYLRRLIQAGHRVAVADQLEDPSQAKGVVKRGVTRVVTPGTLTDEALLDEGRPNSLAALLFLDANRKSKDAKQNSSRLNDTASQRIALSWVDLSTGSFQLVSLPSDQALDELARVSPSELLVCETADSHIPARSQQIADQLGCPATGRPAWQFRQEHAIELLCKHFRVDRLDGFGLSHAEPALAAAAAALNYIIETQCPDALGDIAQAATKLAHLRPPQLFQQHDYLLLDQTTLRSLEVERTLRTGSTDGSLLATFSHTVTAMGRRTLRHWLCYPLNQIDPIAKRQRAVSAILEDPRLARQLGDLLSQVQDVERIVSRITIQRASPRDVVALGQSLGQLQTLIELLADRPAFGPWQSQLAPIQSDLAALSQSIVTTCVESPPTHLRDGGLFIDGHDASLDEARSLQRDANTWLAQYQQEQIQATGVDALKVGYNKVFGYYIELTAAQWAKVDEDVPAFNDWSRKQTLKNAERFITPELKDFESRVLSAESRAIEREQQLFAELCQRVSQHLEAIETFARLIAEIDALRCFAKQASFAGYVQPALVDEPVLKVKAGRHPVLDQILGESFVPNDIELAAPKESPSDDSDRSLALITGPNMAGKSTYIRQAALITLLTHTGAFVPAEAATVGLTDRIFTRIGASDELHTGQSTFMVEMTETANICHHATNRSLVILDEIGRGTSTLDGLALAWAIAEHLAELGPRTLFATHYHELTQLAEQRPNVGNLHVTVREWQDDIIFLHRILPGATNRSYGVHVARIAGLPAETVERAQALLEQLSVSHQPHPTPGPSQPNASKSSTPAVTLFDLAESEPHPCIEALNQVDLHALTPLAAFDLIRQWKQLLDEEEDEDD